MLENIGTRDAEWRVEIVPPSGGLEGPCPVTFSPEGGMLAAFGTATERGIFAAPEPENEDEAPAEGARFSKCELNVKVTSQDLGPLRYIAKIWVEGLAAVRLLSSCDSLACLLSVSLAAPFYSPAWMLARDSACYIATQLPRFRPCDNLTSPPSLVALVAALHA